jgi:predicted DNA binding protein
MGGANVSVTNGVINIASVTGNIVITAVAEETVKMINQIPISTNTDGTLYVGTNGEKGYNTNIRLSASSGNESTSSATGLETTGFMPFKYGQTIYIEGITITEATTENVVYYNSSKQMVAAVRSSVAFDGVVNGEKANSIDIGTLYTDRDLTVIAYIRMTANNIDSNSILTVDQPIV